MHTVKGEFFGRQDELKLLDEAWAGNETRIIQFRATGGTGKTKLIREWLNRAEPENLIVWSFYAQGSSEDKQTSATPFFSHVFEVLNAEKRLETDFISPEAKGEYLAQLLNRQRCVLVLDGLEPMQYVDQAKCGELKDRALRALLTNLSGSGVGLCIITTRIAVHELSDRAHVLSHKLDNLALEDGVQLLRYLGVKGRQDELEKAVEDYGCHALALSLLGNLLRIRYQGDVHKHLTLKSIITTSKNKENQHAFKVMQAYAEYFTGQTELALLSLLGLFDHPIEIEVLRVLWEAQIPELTAGIDEGDWWEAIETLRHEYQLLAERVGGEELDCHPLIREYFGKRLEEGNREVWRKAHACLYEYYKNLPEKEFPDTLEEMQPLCFAVRHACLASLYIEGANLYFSRVDQVGKRASTRKVLDSNDDINVLSNFFSQNWTPLSFIKKDAASILSEWAANSLIALGRLKEAIPLLKFRIDFGVSANYADVVVSNAITLTEIMTLTGNLTDAKLIIDSTMLFLKECRYQKRFHSILVLCAKAELLHQLGFIQEAFINFQDATVLQATRGQDKPQRLVSLHGFQFCQVLLDMGLHDEVLKHSQIMIEVSNLHGDYRDGILGSICAGLAYLEHSVGSKIQAEKYLDYAVNTFRQLGDFKDLWSYGFLGRAKLYCHTKKFAQAYADLQEVYDIAKPSGMRLHLTDYHLEIARLLIAEGKAPTSEVKEHVYHAEKLINDTGYHRRDKELADLKEQLKALL